MFRILAIFAGFLAVTIALLTLQPSPQAPVVADAAPAPAPLARTAAQSVSRDATSPLDDVPVASHAPALPDQSATQPVQQESSLSALNGAILQSLSAAQPATQPVTRPATQPAQDTAPTQFGTAFPTPGEQDMRALSWTVLKDIDTALGRSASPGAPGSLLHTIVSRSLAESPAVASGVSGRNNYIAQLVSEAGPPLVGSHAAPRLYTVQPGDTLQMIAWNAFGDQAHFETIYEANRDIIGSPDNLRPGQVLMLPAIAVSGN